MRVHEKCGLVRAAGSLFALLLLIAACADKPPEKDPKATGGLAGIFFGGEERGYLEPCGCTRPQLGGLPRKGLAVAGGALLENGDLVMEPGRLSELKFETYLLALSRIGCQALNVGEGDLVLGVDYLKSAAGVARFPLISANLLDDKEKLVFPPTVDFEVAGDSYRVMGLLDPALAPAHEFYDPMAAAKSVAKQTPQGIRLFLLYHGPREGAAAILESVPRIEAASYAHGGGEPSVRTDRLFTPGDRSRWMIRLGRRAAVIELSEGYPDHPGVRRVLNDYVRRLAEEDLLGRMNPRTPVGGGGYAGDQACAACHEEAFGRHERSKHAHAVESIAATGREVDPDCVKCHVVGYGQDTGFLNVTETPGLARVGCESCHGPAKDHTANPERSKTVRKAARTCQECHTVDTDPGFRFLRKWELIKHG